MRSFLFILLIHLVVTLILITEPFLLVGGDSSHEESIRDVNKHRF